MIRTLCVYSFQKQLPCEFLLDTVRLLDIYSREGKFQKNWYPSKSKPSLDSRFANALDPKDRLFARVTYGKYSTSKKQKNYPQRCSPLFKIQSKRR